MSGLRIVPTLVVMGALRDVAARDETGTAVEADFALTAALLERLRGGRSRHPDRPGDR